MSLVLIGVVCHWLSVSSIGYPAVHRWVSELVFPTVLAILYLHVARRFSMWNVTRSGHDSQVLIRAYVLNPSVSFPSLTFYVGVEPRQEKRVQDNYMHMLRMLACISLLKIKQSCPLSWHILGQWRPNEWQSGPEPKNFGSCFIVHIFSSSMMIWTSLESNCCD